MPGTRFFVEINPDLPIKLDRLIDLSSNLWYTWDKGARAIFALLEPNLWDAVGHNPKLFLRRVSQKKLEQAEQDNVFLANYRRVLSNYDSYHQERQPHLSKDLLAENDLVAYFCAEFGFHESLPFYSGGLGILAGDHCKVASDLRLPFVAVGLLYRQGYFSQQFDADGNQIALYHENRIEDLPLFPARVVPNIGTWKSKQDTTNEDIVTTVHIFDRPVHLKVWQGRVGHIMIYLLDSNLPENAPEDRQITYQLYGGDLHMRIRQEIVLGLGGIRALKALGITPTVYHINEGHAAFSILERVRAFVEEEGLTFEEALETTAANTIFTTHTPVPAGHDHFPISMMEDYFRPFREKLKIDPQRFFMLGRTSPEQVDFNQTILALKGSRFHNGVSRIHGRVSAEIAAPVWPELSPDENPITYITNGVHVPSFLSREWSNAFENYLGSDWIGRMSDVEFWDSLDAIPDHLYWSIRQSLKSRLFSDVQERVSNQYRRAFSSNIVPEDLFHYLNPENPNTLVIGFGRRFATYKRADLILTDMERLKAICNQPDRPVIFIFAGKAHPADYPGQEIIRKVWRASQDPALYGKLFLVEGYDLDFARRMVSGCDIWLNNPVYPLEASGTSGMKAGINGVLNLSILDGWWAEGYDGTNGWGITPAPAHYDDGRRRFEESKAIYHIIEKEILPSYYTRNAFGYSSNWVYRSKRSMATIMTRFNIERMVHQYVEKLYAPAARHGDSLYENRYAKAKELAAWKKTVVNNWPKVTLRLLAGPKEHTSFGEPLFFRVAAALAGLTVKDVKVELLLDSKLYPDMHVKQALMAKEKTASGETIYELLYQPLDSGAFDWRIRLYPSYEDLLAHPFELGLMRWL